MLGFDVLKGVSADYGIKTVGRHVTKFWHAGIVTLALDSRILQHDFMYQGSFATTKVQQRVWLILFKERSHQLELLGTVVELATLMHGLDLFLILGIDVWSHRENSL